VNLINGARAGKGRAPLQLLPVALVAANIAYAQSVLRQLIATKTCDHNLPAWQAFQASSTGSRMRPMSEVLGCPEARGRWNPERLLSRWLGSPLHNDILLNRPRNSHAACVQLSEAGRIGVLCSSGWPSEHRPQLNSPWSAGVDRPWTLRGSGSNVFWGGP